MVKVPDIVRSATCAKTLRRCAASSLDGCAGLHHPAWPSDRSACSARRVRTQRARPQLLLMLARGEKEITAGAVMTWTPFLRKLTSFSLGANREDSLHPAAREQFLVQSPTSSARTCAAASFRKKAERLLRRLVRFRSPAGSSPNSRLPFRELVVHRIGSSIAPGKNGLGVAVWHDAQLPGIQVNETASNQAFNLTRLRAYSLGGCAVADAHAMRWPCTSSAARLNASVRRNTPAGCRLCYGARIRCHRGTRRGRVLHRVSSCPARCHTQARSLDQLMERIREAIALCLEVQGEPADSLDFIGVQRVRIQHEPLQPSAASRSWPPQGPRLRVIRVRGVTTICAIRWSHHSGPVHSVSPLVAASWSRSSRCGVVP